MFVSIKNQAPPEPRTSIIPRDILIPRDFIILRDAGSPELSETLENPQTQENSEIPEKPQSGPVRYYLSNLFSHSFPVTGYFEFPTNLYFLLRAYSWSLRQTRVLDGNE